VQNLKETGDSKVPPKEERRADKALRNWWCAAKNISATHKRKRFDVPKYRLDVWCL